MSQVVLFVIIFLYSGETQAAAVKVPSISACNEVAPQARAILEADPAVRSTSAYCVTAVAKDKT